MKNILPFSASFLLVAAMLTSCNSGYKNADLTVVDFPTYDSSKFDPLDKPSGKMFDILSNVTTGLDFSNDVGFRMRNDNNIYNYFYNGAGVAVLNVNGDSLPDLYFTGNIVHDRLFINEGNMRFTDQTEAAGILTKNKGWSTGVSVVDINSDGFDDIYVCRSRWKDTLSKLLYINDGQGHFTEHAKEYGIDAPDTYTIMANFFDYDKDGDVDLFLANHPTDWVEKMRFNNLEKIENHSNQSDRLFRNDGNNHFTDVSKQAGINTHGYGLSCTAADLNGDSWPDLYVANDFAMHDYYFVNQKDGTFKESARNILKKTSLFGMGADIGDINNDGYADLFVVDMKFDHSYMRRSFMLAQRRAEFNNMVSSGYHYQYVRNMLQLNNGNGTFSEIGCLAGVDATEWSWSPLMVDLDNDGYEDIFVSNGYYKTFNIDERELVQGLKDATRRGDTVMFNKISTIINKKKLKDPNVVFKNNGDLTFSRMTNEWGFFQPTITHGAAFADFDRDGDVDIITSNTEESPLLYRNNESVLLKNNYIDFSFKGSTNNNKGIGTEVRLYTKNGIQFQSYHIVRGYQSCSENMMHFGLGTTTAIDKVIVTWPDGKTQTLTNVTPNHIVTLNYSDANEKAPEQQKPNLIFTNVTDKLKIDFRHEEDPYDDFKRELLLPEKNSYFGPGLAVGDVNGDGLDDFFVGGASRQAGTLFLQTANGEFIHFDEDQPWEKDKAADCLGMLFFDADADKDLDLYIATGGNEFGVNDKNYRDHLYFNDGKGKFSSDEKAIPDLYTSGSCVVAGDYDNDGDLDLFVGGRVTPQKYPTPARSAIFRNDKGKFTDVTSEVAPGLEKAGLVCGALWTDFNNDNKLDLILAGEWMPITFLKNNDGKMEDVTGGIGFQNTTGWWNSIVSGDFDNDGDVDYIAGNEGLNTRYYKPTEKQPIDLYSHDFDKNGTNDVVMSFFNFDQSYPVKNLQYSAEQMPVLAKEFKTYSGFALSSTEEIYGPKGLDKAYHLTAKTLASSYIENQGDGKFAIRPLPTRAQVSSMFGMVVYDVNGDGNLDLIYHGNFYNKESETERDDAFVGEVMLGDGKGGFNYLSSRESGFFSDKDAKALAIISVGKNQSPVILGTNNNDKMFAYQLNTNNSKVPYTEQDKYADIFLKDGRRVRLEMNIGSGFLSENSKEVAFIPSLTDKVVITDYKNQQRTAYQAQALAAK